MSPYVIVIEGCDDSTAFDIDLTADEARVAERIAEMSRRTSQFDCQPKMTVRQETDPS